MYAGSRSASWMAVSNAAFSVAVASLLRSGLVIAWATVSSIGRNSLLFASALIWM
jgi:hypothetical protein